MKKYSILFTTILLFLALFSNAQSYSGTGPLTLTTPVGASNIQWYKDGAIIAGQTASTYSASTIGTYHAIYDASAGCLAVKTEIVILVSSCAGSSGLPVTLNAATAGITGYQWYNQSGIIAGQTASSYVASTGGTYYVEYAQGVSCNSNSEKYYVFVLDCPCVAGSTAPTLSSTTKANVCPATTANLSALVTSTCPTGSSLQWHTVNTGLAAANKVSDATMVSVGTYYPTCFDATNACYSPVPATGVTVSITSCVACPAIGTAAPSLK